MHPYSVLLKPVLSEKSTEIRETDKKYTFEVVLGATKEDVRKAIAKMWDVKVAKVSTLRKRGKIKRRGAHFSKPRQRKIAYVTLAEGQKLPLFEDQ